MRSDQLALQLYTVRSELERDPLRTLQAVALLGYQNVELAGTASLDVARFHELLSTAGLRAVGAHVGLDKVERTDEALRDAEALGHRLLIVPWVGEEFKRDFAGGAALGARLSAVADAIRPHGYRLGYHNHTFELEGAPGKRLWDGLLSAAPPDLQFEIDVCWAQVAGLDPVELLGGLRGRVVSLHLKDVDADGRRPRIPGAGILPWREIIDAGDQNGAEWFVIEEDDPADALEAAALGHGFIRGFASP